jgi:hypothetical protein
MVIKRPDPAAIGNASIFIEDVQPLRPRRIRIVCAIVHIIDSKWQRKLEAFHEIVGDRHTLLQVLWLRVANVILHVRFHLPFIGGMGLAHIHSQKIGVIFVILVDLNDVADLATKRRSSEAAENENQRALLQMLPNVERPRPIQRQYARVGGLIAHPQISAMHMRQRVTHHAVHVVRASSHDR